MDPDGVMVSPTAWGTSGSLAVSVEDIATMYTASSSTRNGSRGRAVPALHPTPPKMKIQTLVPSEVPLELVEACSLSEQWVKSVLTVACPEWEIWLA